MHWCWGGVGDMEATERRHPQPGDVRNEEALEGRRQQKENLDGEWSAMMMVVR